MSDIIPDELWRRILEIGVGTTPKLLEYKDLCCLSIVSRRLNRLSCGDSLWSSLLSSDFPLNQNTPSTTSSGAAAAAPSSSNISRTSPNSSSKALYKIRLEKDRARKLAAHRRAVLRIESQIAEHSRKLQEIQLRSVEETERVRATAAELSHLHKVRQASAALNVWQPEVVRGKHKQIVEQCAVPADSRIHALEMEIRLCKQQVASLDKAYRTERRRLDAAKEQLASIKYHPLRDYSLTIHRLDEGGVKRKKLKKEHINCKTSD